MAKWYVAAKKADFDGIAKRFGISPVTARIIRNRDIVGDEQIRKYLSGTPDEMYAPALLKGMREAVCILRRKIGEGKKIRVIGDYDVDGICSAYILERGLRHCGALADAAIPHRMKDGYGINDDLVRAAFDDGIDTIVTCDNGIAAPAQVTLAKSLGMTVILTDHHEVPYEEEAEAEGGRSGTTDTAEDAGRTETTGKTGEKRRYIVPEADAVIDPKQPGCAYPWREICGAVIVYKLIQELFDRCGLLSGDEAVKMAAEAVLSELTELAAFATVCDVMPLQDENRILVKHGLSLMQNTKNEGLRALMEVSRILPQTEGKKLTAFHIGFVLGPCLNASGRLDTAARALELLECETREEAIPKAAFLKQLNDSRKEMTDTFVKAAVEAVEESGIKNDRVLVIYLPDCHESIAGIIAGRIRERYYRPVFVLTDAMEGVKGSARSIESYHIYEEMTKCSHFFTRYGGHRMAAGLSMKKEDVDDFRREINALCTLTPEDMQERIHIDVPMPVSYVTFSLVEELEKLEPFGTGNEKPVFAQKDLLFLSARVLGKNGNAVRFTVADDQDRRMEMMYFGDRNEFDSHVRRRYGDAACSALYEGRGGGIRLSAVYYSGINTWQGNTRLQLVMQYYQ